MKAKIIMISLAFVCLSAGAQEGKSFIKKGSGSTYVKGLAGCGEAQFLAISKAKIECFSVGFNECTLMSSKKISERLAVVDGDYNQIGVCTYEATVSGTIFDEIKASEESERRM